MTYFSLPATLAIHGFLRLIAEPPHRQAVDANLRARHLEDHRAPLDPDSGSKQLENLDQLNPRELAYELAHYTSRYAVCMGCASTLYNVVGCGVKSESWIGSRAVASVLL